MANTYTLIASNTVGSGGAASIAFSSIPATYTDLLVKISARSDSAVYYTPVWIVVNSITSGYTNRFLDVYNNAPTSSTDWFGITSKMPAGAATGANDTASTFSNNEVFIPNYAGSANKPSLVDGTTENLSSSNNQWYLFLSANLLSNTAAVTSLTFTLNAGSFVQYSSIYLYGIKNS